ncbi:MAG: ribonuclease HII [Bacilli bacterium]|nr:ribonuclease HII [Bacilli bacterium]
MLDFEDQYYSDEVKLIVGIDEAGRGPLCGPVVAACCILKPGYKNEHINDSKKLTEKQREAVYKEILENCVDYGVGIVSPQRIDEINILEATKEAMKMSLDALKSSYDLILVDAVKLQNTSKPVIPIIKGDAKCECIAAASIIAKVTRDHILEEYAKRYPEYGFDKHKGYGTKKHIEAIEKYGIIKDFYRLTFEPVKSMTKK